MLDKSLSSFSLLVKVMPRNGDRLENINLAEKHACSLMCNFLFHHFKSRKKSWKRPAVIFIYFWILKSLNVEFGTDMKACIFKVRKVSPLWHELNPLGPRGTVDPIQSSNDISKSSIFLLSPMPRIREKSERERIPFFSCHWDHRNNTAISERKIYFRANKIKIVCHRQSWVHAFRTKEVNQGSQSPANTSPGSSNLRQTDGRTESFVLHS